MLKKIIKTHTARLDFVDIIKPRNAVATNRQRRVIASIAKQVLIKHITDIKIGSLNVQIAK